MSMCRCFSSFNGMFQISKAPTTSLQICFGLEYGPKPNHSFFSLIYFGPFKSHFGFLKEVNVGRRVNTKTNTT